MIFLLRLILIALFSLLISMLFPWWSAILSSAIIAFILKGNNFNAFLSGFLGVGLVWMVTAWKIDIETNSILSLKIVTLFPFEDKNMLVVLTGVIGGVAGGLGAFLGNSFRLLFVKKKKTSFYS